MTDYGIMRVPQGHSTYRPASRRWVVFAALVLVVGAILNVLYGFSAIYNDDYVREEEYLYGPVTLWGWFSVGIGVVMFATAIGLFLRFPNAAWFGILIAAISAITRVLSIGAQTWWGLVVIVIDLLVIYGLWTHGFERR